MKRLLSALALFAALLSSFAFAATSQLGMQYATSTVFRDCAQKPLSITNRTEFLPFYAQPANEANIAKILALAAEISSKDPAAASAQQTYLQCGDYVLSGQNGTLYWRGIELTPPGYVRELEARVIELESQASQSSFVQKALGQSVSLLEADALRARSDFVRFQCASLGLMVLIFCLLVWHVFFSNRQESRFRGDARQGGRRASKMTQKKRG